MKVAHITTVDHSIQGLLLNQLRSLKAAGFDVYSISAPGTDVPEIEAAGIKHIAVPMTRNFSPLADLSALFALYQVMRRERFTIVHTHTPKPGLLGQLAARMAGVPIIVNTLHGFYFHDRMSAFWRRFYITTEKIAARCSHLILSQNSEDIQTARRESIGQAVQFKFLGNGIDVRRFDRSQIAEETLMRMRAEFGITPQNQVVGFVGRLVKEKGILELMAAAQTILRRKPNTKFLFVGPVDDDKADAFRPETAHDYGIADACIFTGRRHDMPELYALMDVFALPSHREGFPRSAMEASAMSVPCVVTDVRGCREAVSHQQNGLLVSLGDVTALAKAILSVLKTSTLARQMGATGRAMALERFDEEIVFSTVKQEYARLLTARGLNAPEALTASMNLASI